MRKLGSSKILYIMAIVACVIVMAALLLLPAVAVPSKFMENDAFQLVISPNYMVADMLPILGTVWQKVLFIALLSFAIVGWLMALIFSILGLAGIKERWNHPLLISLGAGLMFLLYIYIYLWGYRLIVGISAAVEDKLLVVYPKEVFQMKAADAGSLKMIGKTFLCLGGGFFLALEGTLILLIYGIIIVHDRKIYLKDRPVPQPRQKARVKKKQKTVDSEKSKAVVPKKSRTGSIQVINGECIGWQIQMQDRDMILVGRDPACCHLILSDPAVDMQHCSITYNAEKGNYIVQDYSDSGTYNMDTGRLPFNMPVEAEPGTCLFFGGSETVLQLRE